MRRSLSRRVRPLSRAASVLAMFLIPACAVSARTVLPSDAGDTRSLDGSWRFKIEQAGGYPDAPRIGGRPYPIVLPKVQEPFQKIDYREDAKWKNLTVPGNWEMAGFSPATYNQPDNAIGLYRLEFDIPADWKGRVVKLNFDGVQNGAEVYLNGQPVNVDEPSDGIRNFHQGGWDAFQADLTPVVKFGEKNLLAIRVYKNTKAVDLDTGDYFFLGGIHRTVTLFSVPKTHLDDLTVRTEVSPDGKAELHVLLDVVSPISGGVAAMRLQGEQPIQANMKDDGHVELVEQVASPRLWSAEHPNLYVLTVELRDAGGRTVETVTRRIGLRQVSIRDGVLLVNNVPVKLTGMCRHDVSPELGTAVNDALWRKDITLMKNANINAIRTSHYPYGSGFYDLCDELGMYVMDEVAACWTPTDTDELTPAFAQHARELVRRDKNHPCVLVWAIGNENAKGKNNRVAAEEIHKIDPTRPRLVSWRDAEEGGVEIDDSHYTDPAAIAQAERQPRRSKYPKSYLENPNDWELRNAADQGNWELWNAVLDRVWREVWDDEHVIGSFNWEWADRAVADHSPVKLYDYYPATGINVVKVKGLCDGFRDPRPGVYDVKMVYAPVKIAPEARVDGSTLIVHAINYYSFTDLSDLHASWHLLKDGSDADTASGEIHASLAPRSRGDLRIDIPGDALSQADAVRLEFNRPDGVNIVEYVLRLRPERYTAPKFDPADLSGVRFPRFNLVTVTYAPNRVGWRTASRHAWRLMNITVARGDAGKLGATPVADEKALCATPLSDVAAMDADLAPADDSDAIVGHVRADCVGGRFTWRLNWYQAPPGSEPATGNNRNRNRNPAGTDVQELGWVFALPAGDDHFSWSRHGYWSWYPPHDVNRLRGTATPDSANVDITRMDRPDAFDFNSTKYHCDWARLADAGGRGVIVSFTPDERGNVRAGTSGDGNRLLVVNKYCCPPRDISTSVVPDYYFTLNRNETVSGAFVLGTSGGRE